MAKSEAAASVGCCCLERDLCQILCRTPATVQLQRHSKLLRSTLLNKEFIKYVSYFTTRILLAKCQLYQWLRQQSNWWSLAHRWPSCNLIFSTNNCILKVKQCNKQIMSCRVSLLHWTFVFSTFCCNLHKFLNWQEFKHSLSLPKEHSIKTNRSLCRWCQVAKLAYFKPFFILFIKGLLTGRTRLK